MPLPYPYFDRVSFDYQIRKKMLTLDSITQHKIAFESIELAIFNNDCRRISASTRRTSCPSRDNQEIYYTFDNVIRRGSIGARIAVTTLGALSGPLALLMPLAICTFAETDPVCLATVTSFGAHAPVAPITPAVAT